MINEKQKWPINKKQYDINYLKVFGKKCPMCGGKPRGIPSKDSGWTTCIMCDGIGYIEK